MLQNSGWLYFLQNATYQISQALAPLQDIAKALQDSDRTNFYLVIFTALAVATTIMFGLWDRRRTNRQIRRSEDRQDDEHFERVRPWVVIEAPIAFQVVYQGNSAQPYDDYMKTPRDLPVQTVSIAFLYSNKGQRVAHNLKEIRHSAFKEFTRQEFENINEIETKMSLAPEQVQTTSLTLTMQRWVKLDKEPIYLGLRISYDNGRGRSVSGGIYKFSNIGAQIIETWYS